jgi:ABC-type Fe3+/spermidine/putrescine transport system ATPase subunit
MNAGAIEQEAPPREIYDAPATAYASSFLGAANLVPVRIVGGMARLADGQMLPVSAGTADRDATLALRQENVDFLSEGGLTARVITRVYLGSRHRYILDLAGQKISVLAPASVMLEPGSQARIGIAPDRVRILPA